MTKISFPDFDKLLINLYHQRDLEHDPKADEQSLIWFRKKSINSSQIGNT